MSVSALKKVFGWGFALVIVFGCAWGASAQSAHEGGGAHLYDDREDKRDVADLGLGEGVSVGGLVEIEVSAGEEDDESVSDIIVATVELGVEAELSSWISAHVLLLWEEGGDGVEVDEAFVTLKDDTRFPLFLEAGRMYIPFGAFNSHFVSDPLTVELGETREEAVRVGFATDYVELSAGAFNGEADEDMEDSEVEEGFAALTLSMGETFSVGAYWISDIGESDALQESIQAQAETQTVSGVSYDGVAGWGGFVQISAAMFVLDAEYLKAEDTFEAGWLGETALEPEAWNVELAVCFDQCELEVAGRWEGSRDFPDVPENQYGMAVSARIAEPATFAIEFLHGEFDGDVPDRDMFTAQLAAEF